MTPILTVVTLARWVPVIVIFVGVFMQYSVGPKFVIMGINWISSFSIEVPNALIEKTKAYKNLNKFEITEFSV